ncbi:MAG: alpha-amylase family glycosyl hydrolase, partial [Oscillospiraceae bacterium]|nr:alpha-amylase family glycosyl hydrolase [Oscillospiraceae bacterium]
MKRKTSKLISVILTLCMLMSCVAVSNFAVSAKDVSEEEVASSAALQSNVQDGVILHAFNWSYNTIKENLPAIAAAGYSTVQTSPVQQPKDYGDWYKVADQWPKLYQPLGFSIASETWLGTKEELASLCDEAHKYGIKIICDVVSNHLANNMAKDTDTANQGVLYSGIADSEPEIYNNTSSSLHSYRGSASDSTVRDVVQGYVSNCPDLNTGSEIVQNRVISLLKECIDCGVDGFRFDAAKHIETPDDGAYGSDYWPNILGAASAYASEKYGKTEYYYGEILNTLGPGRNIDSYTKYMSVTDNKTGNSTLTAMKSKNAANAAKYADSHIIGAASDKSVLWAESHDTYMGGESNGVSDENIVKAWAMVAAQSDATALYFARPGDALMGQAAENTDWKGVAVSEINKFHNNFVGQADKTGSSGKIAYVTRGDSGIVIVNCSGTSVDVSLADTGMADGTYTDTITGNTFTVAGGVVTGSIGSTGVAVVYDSTPTPRNTNTVQNCSFRGNSLQVTLGLVNATSGTYQIGDSAPVTYTSDTTIFVGSNAAYNTTVTLTLTATDGKSTTTDIYQYEKLEPYGTGVYVCYKNTKKWAAPFYAYVYDELTNPDADTVVNAAWPGEKMSYDAENDLYYYEVPKYLAESENTQVVINNNNGGKQYPGQTSKTKLNLQCKSHLLDNIAWDVISYTPPEEPTEPETTVPPTTEPVTTEPETTVPVTTEPVTTEPVTTEPPTTEPVTTEPPTTEPVTTEPVTTEPPTTEPVTTEPVTTEPTTVGEIKYYIAGDEGLVGVQWDPAGVELVKGEYTYDGAAYDYSVTFNDVAAGSYAFKVTDGTWTNCWGKDGGNFTVNLTKAADVTVYFNSESKAIAVESDGIGAWEFEYITAAGNGDGAWLNGANWDPADETNIMTEVEPGIWEITYTDVPADNGYE